MLGLEGGGSSALRFLGLEFDSRRMEWNGLPGPILSC